MTRISGPVSKFVLLICLLVGQWHLQWIRLPNDNWQHIIQSDGEGYYAYLPAIFIFKSFDFETSQSPDGKSRIEKSEKGGAIKYFVGESLLLLPFFTAADLITQTLDLSTRNGYSFYYPLFVSIAALFYALLGLVSLRSLLFRMGFNDWVIALCLAILFFGTQLYLYTLHDPAMSHVYSFSMIAVLLNQYQIQITRYSKYRWLLIAAVASLIILVRPVNAVFIGSFLVFLHSNQQLKDFFRSYLSSGWVIIASSILIALALLFIQPLMYYLQTGTWWVYSYGGEGFNWSDPHILDVLLSYRKGLFVYAPILLLAIPGSWFLKKKFSGFSALSWLGLMGLFTYITSSWWYWAYGGSFGMRPFIDSYGLFVVPLASFLEASFNYLAARIALAIVCSGLIFFQLFQTYQYVQNILPYEGMNETKYWHLFLKSGHQFNYAYPPDDDFKPIKQPGTVFLDSTIGNELSEVELFYHGDEKTSRYELIVAEWDKLFEKADEGSQLYVEISSEAWMEDPTSDASIIVNLQKDWQAYFWERRFLVHQVIRRNEWTSTKFVLPIPIEQKEGSFFVVSIHNNNKSIIKARKLRVRIFAE